MEQERRVLHSRRGDNGLVGFGDVLLRQALML